MGSLVDGEWKIEDVNPKNESGEYKRQNQKFRSRIEKKGEFPPEEGRYHLYVSYACPWAHRTLIMRKLKKLETFLPYSVVSPEMLDLGWSFKKTDPGVTDDPIYGKEHLKDVYTEVDPSFTGKVTVPVLIDKKQNKIVNNESSEIIRILNGDLIEFSDNSVDYYPKALRSEIDEVNEDIYHNVNNGVYKTGFARNQKAYEHNFTSLFDSLDRQEKRLEGEDFLVGGTLTEADIRFYTTLARFDAVYFTHFKCNKKLIQQYPNLQRYLKLLGAMEEFSSTTNMRHIKRHYFYSHKNINPYQIVPLGPEVDFLS